MNVRNERAPRLDIYRDMTYPDGDLTAILEAQLNELEPVTVVVTT